MKKISLYFFTSVMCLACSICKAQPTTPEYKYSTPVPPGIAVPESLQTRFGKLNFVDGMPDKDSTEKLYDNLDFQRAVQAYLLALPVVNQMGNLNGIL